MSSTINRLLPAASLVIAIVAQWALLNAKDVGFGIALYIVAIGFILISAPRDLIEPPSELLSPMSLRGAILSGATVLSDPELDEGESKDVAQSKDATKQSPLQSWGLLRSARNDKWRLLALVACVTCTMGSFTLNADASFSVREGVEYQFTLAGVVAWTASVAFFVLAFWTREKSISQWRIGKFDSTMLALVAVLVLGAFFYFYNLDGVPAEMTSDHAEKLLDINDILTGHYPVFFVRNTGREPIQFYVTAVLMKLFNLPLNHIALKVGTALIGWLTIPVTFLLAREMFGDRVGIMSAFFVATMHWATAIARIGLRYPYTPLFAALSFFFVWRGMKYQKRNDFLVAGLVMGAGLYGYIPSRNIPLVALGILALWAVFDGPHHKIDWKQFVKNIALMLSGILVVFMPLLRYSLDYSEMFWYRALTRVSSAEEPIRGNLFEIFLGNLKNLALMFNVRGDEVWPTNISYQPTFDVASAALLVLGVVLAVYWMIRGRRSTYLYLLAAFIAFLLPSALSLAFPQENPSLVRTSGAIPFAAILLALPLTALGRTAREHSSRIETSWRWVLIGAICATIIALNYRWYFFDYDSNYRHYAQNSSEVATVIRGFDNSIGDLQHAYFVGYPYWIDGRAIAINLGDIQWKNFSLDANDWINDDQTNRLYILNLNDEANLETLTDYYPQGQTKIRMSRTPGKDFLSFFVPAE